MENVSKLTVVGRIECAQGSTSQPLYITIANDTQTDSQTIRLIRAQSTEQHWCLVRTPSMGEKFIICSYPTTDRVLQATEVPIDAYEKAFRIKVVKLPTNIVLGRPLPMPMDKYYQFTLEEKKPGDRCRTGCFIRSESEILSDNVVQGGYKKSKDETPELPPEPNDHVSIHLRALIHRELFWFENVPTK